MLFGFLMKKEKPLLTIIKNLLKLSKKVVIFIIFKIKKIVVNHPPKEQNQMEQYKEKSSHLVFENFTSGLNEVKNTNGMWKIESVNPITGGIVSWNSQIRLKHLRFI